MILSLLGYYNFSSLISSQKGQIIDLQLTITQKNSDIVSYKNKIQSLKSTLASHKNKIRSLNSALISYKDSLRILESQFIILSPIYITNIDIANSYYDGKIETDFGKTIYSSNTMYLIPKITYTGINHGSTINLKIKWYGPDGFLRTGNSSPNGFTQQVSLYVYNGLNSVMLQGWGNKTKGLYWGKGMYRIEVWYENVCLRAKTFTIY